MMPKRPEEIVNPQACLFESVKSCVRQNLRKKVDFQLCTCCLLSRVEKHAYAIVKKFYANEPQKPRT